MDYIKGELRRIEKEIQGRKDYILKKVMLLLDLQSYTIQNFNCIIYQL
jgi:hypothetical protein